MLNRMKMIQNFASIYTHWTFSFKKNFKKLSTYMWLMFIHLHLCVIHVYLCVAYVHPSVN
jgi:hypothetical protein